MVWYIILLFIPFALSGPLSSTKIAYHPLEIVSSTTSPDNSTETCWLPSVCEKFPSCIGCYITLGVGGPSSLIIVITTAIVCCLCCKKCKKKEQTLLDVEQPLLPRELNTVDYFLCLKKEEEPLSDVEQPKERSASYGQGKQVRQKKQEEKEKSKTGLTIHTEKAITNPGQKNTSPGPARQEKGKKTQTEHTAQWRKAQILPPKQEEKERNKRIDERQKQEKKDRKEAFDLAKTLWTDKYRYIINLPDLGCRLQKYWSLREESKEESKEERNREQFLQTIAPCSKKCLISLDDQETLDSLTDLYKYLSSLKHPYLQTITEFTRVSGQVSIIQPLFKNGSLRDKIFEAKPTADWSDKYTGKGQSLPPDMIATFGKQILKAVRCLYDVGFPLLSHIHTGNIFIEVDEEWKEVCRLGGYENTLLGYRTLNYKKIFEGGHLNKIDVIMFGHVIYEMASGQVLVDVYPSKEEYERVKDIPEVFEVLHFIFDTKWKGSHKKMLKKVENHAFFKRVHLTEFKNNIKLTYPLKQLLDKVRKGKPVVVTDQHTTSSDRVEFDFMETTEPYCEIYSERESLAQIGWRSKRVWGKVTCAHHGEGLLSLTPVPSTCPIFVHDSIKTLEKLLTAINHPYIQQVHGIHYRKIEEKHVVFMFQPLRTRGSIRDIIYECTPLQQWDSKYTEIKCTFGSKDIALFGHQILEAVSFLYQLGFPRPLGHIHTGNIFVDGDTCRLGGYENTLLGYRTHHYDKYRDHLESIDVIMFGHVIFEMCTGREISTLTPSNSDYEDVRDSGVKKFLKFIFAQEDDEFIHGIDEIIAHDFFKDISSFPGYGAEKSEGTDLSKDARVLLQKVRKGKPQDQNSAVKRTKNKAQEVFRQMPWEKLNREKQVEVDVH